MDMRDAIAETLEWTAGVVAGTESARFVDPTPCSAWDVRALLNHLVAGNVMYAMALAGEPPDAERLHADQLGEDAVAAYRASAARAASLWRSADLDATLVLPYGAMPASFSVGTHQMDHLLHGWDLLVATDRPRRVPADLVEVARTTIDAFPPEIAAAPGVFAPSVTVAAGADAFDALAAQCGRTVPGELHYCRVS